MLRQRMYSFVIYQLSGIQKGIQAGHAWMEYIKSFYNTEECRQWINNDKTVIILNGGNIHLIKDISDKLEVLDISHCTFEEPDLGNVTTALAFLVDERVWDEEKWPIDDGIIRFPAIQYPEIPDNIKSLRNYLSNFRLATN
jgi:hypothetical protein